MRVYGPDFQSKVRQKSHKQKGLRVRSENLHKKSFFDECPNKIYSVTKLDGNLWKVSYFLNKLIIFSLKKKKNMGSLGNKFVNFDQKLNLKHNGSFGDRTKFLGVLGWGVSWKKGVLRILHSVSSNMGVPTGFKLYYNPNCIKVLWVILIFATPAGGHECTTEHLECPSKSGNQRHSAKVLNSDFYLCPRSKPHLQNCLIDSKDFLTQTAQGRKHIKSKIKW